MPSPEKEIRKLPKYNEPKIGFFDILFGQKNKKLTKYKNAYSALVSDWEEQSKADEELYQKSLNKWQKDKDFFKETYNNKKIAYLEKQQQHNLAVDNIFKGLAEGEPAAVLEYASMILDKSDYEDFFEKSYQLDYIEDEKTLLIEYGLPSPDIMPDVKNVRFVAATKELKKTIISDREKKTNYDLTCYQICLRTLYEIFSSDVHKNINKVLFNGVANYIDQATGQEVSACIMSVLVDSDAFSAIDLSRVEPKACFKSLKGVSASSLSALAAIAPVMKIDKHDKRFVDARESEIDETTNLAAMDWDDFEHLVREVFEKEFASRGGEVKITQASNDGGVDAVAFDPDPITGGKIVIQAKRYTRTVGVSAVRDLYGTMQHEGASRGILITTADYGPDAYSFANGKPISLFTGSNLLHLLSQHGYKAKIDIQAARKELNLRN